LRLKKGMKHLDRLYQCELTNFCLIRYQHQLLMMAKNDSEFEPSLTFPGGHVEPDDSLTASVVREVKEETSLDVNDPQLCSIVNFVTGPKTREFIFAYATTVSQKMTTQPQVGTKDEGRTFWIDIDQIKPSQLNTVVADVLQDYRSGIVREHDYPLEK
jgi:8-oxo-dGTP diphosphatase